MSGPSNLPPIVAAQPISFDRCPRKGRRSTSTSVRTGASDIVVAARAVDPALALVSVERVLKGDAPEQIISSLTSTALRFPRSGLSRKASSETSQLVNRFQLALFWSTSLRSRELPPKRELRLGKPRGGCRAVAAQPPSLTPAGGCPP